MASERDEKRIAAWMPVRERGLVHFMIFRGLLYWGLLMFAVMSVFIPSMSEDGIQLRQVLTGAVIWPPAGLLWGFLTYKLNDHAIRRLERKSP